MGPWTVLAALGVVVLALAVFVLVRPHWIASGLVRRPVTRSAFVAPTRARGSWCALFVASVRGIPEGRGALRAALGREKGASEVLRALLVRCLTEALAARGDGFSGTADREFLRAAEESLRRAGLRLEGLSLVRAVRLDDRLARLARWQVMDAVRGAYQGPCDALELYVDGVSGLGEWSVETWETGRNRLTNSRGVVRQEASKLQVFRPPSRLLTYRSLASLMDED